MYKKGKKMPMKPEAPEKRAKGILLDERDPIIQPESGADG